MKIIKIINNNNVCVIDEQGREQIVAGKGIGFSKKCGDTVSKEQIQKTYLITNTEMQKKVVSMLEEIPEEYVNFTHNIVEKIKESYPYQISDSLLVTLSDHIAFAIERKRQGMIFQNPLLLSIEQIYPQELRLGEYCIEQMKEQLDIEMDRNEASYIAMHIINARLDLKMSDVYDITKMISGCIEIAEFYYHKSFRKTVSYERFQLHLKYLAQRLMQNTELPITLSKDSAFVNIIRKTCREDYKCAKCIEEYIVKTFQKDINEDEIITLTIHLKKMSCE